MLNFNTLIQNEYESAYENAYDLSLKKQFSIPKIYTAKGDLSKRWYVYFSYRNPDTGRLKRQNPFYGNANTYKTKEERMAVLTIYKNIIYKYLRKGYSPYGDTLEKTVLDTSFEQHVSQKPAGVPLVENEDELKARTEMETTDVFKGETVQGALESVLETKERRLRQSSIRSFKSHLNVFIDWMDKERCNIKYISDVDRKTIHAFLDNIHAQSSARNRNNYRASLSSAFETLVEREVVHSNIVKQIKKLKTRPKQHARYSAEQQGAIFKFLKKEDPYILLYIKFMAYTFMRPLEVCRLMVGDVDLEKKTLSFKPKNGSRKTKIIPEILIKQLPDLSDMESEAFLFTAEGMGKFTKTKLENRRSYFTNRFKKRVKGRFELDLEHTMYSFRHTFITKLYRELRKTYSPFEAKSRLMHITGHTSMKALEAYLRDNDVELPEDYSDMLNIQNKGNGEHK